MKSTSIPPPSLPHSPLPLPAYVLLAVDTEALDLGGAVGVGGDVEEEGLGGHGVNKQKRKEQGD